MYRQSFPNSGQTADKTNFWQKEKLTNGSVKPNVNCACGAGEGT